VDARDKPGHDGATFWGLGMTDTLKILTICGSLRKGSYNAALARMAPKLAPAGMTFTDAPSFAQLPIYNHDDQEASGFPPSVTAWADAIRAADALLIVTPEYNYSVPGVLKNAIDWASRPPTQPFEDKPVALTGASPSMLNAHVLNRPEVMIASAPTRFDDQLRLTDDKTREMIINLLTGLRDWTLRLRA
jgi:chromate reductase, NAD(P)H dehydrogenase (quinone)